MCDKSYPTNCSFLPLVEENRWRRENEVYIPLMSPTYYHGLRALDFSIGSGCDQIVCNPTHNCLDLIFPDILGIVASSVGSPTGTSDYCYVLAVIKTKQGVLDILYSFEICLKPQANWDCIFNDFCELKWTNIHLKKGLSCLKFSHSL